jgi:hypothetical protein
MSVPGRKTYSVARQKVPLDVEFWYMAKSPYFGVRGKIAFFAPAGNKRHFLGYFFSRRASIFCHEVNNQNVFCHEVRGTKKFDFSLKDKTMTF